MAGQGGKKVKINYSSVHEEFDIVDNYYHPTLESFGEARKCKICKFVISGKSSTNLEKSSWSAESQQSSDKMLAIWIGGSNLLRSSSPRCQPWPRTSWPYQLQVSQARDSSPYRGFLVRIEDQESLPRTWRIVS